jgi:hypothetical protein
MPRLRLARRQYNTLAVPDEVEAPPEIVTTRIVWAVGYFNEDADRQRADQAEEFGIP